jgi:hypothetical protein
VQNEVKGAGQLELDLFGSKGPELYLDRSYSGFLWDALDREYRRIGLECINDEVFKQLVLARIIEPTSKLDTIRVLASGLPPHLIHPFTAV